MNKKLRMTCGYFIEQKFMEICYVISFLVLFLSLFVGVPIALGMSIGDNISVYCNKEKGIYESWESYSPVECGVFNIWGEGFLYLIMILMIGWIIYSWINSNWKKAKRKTEYNLNGGCGDWDDEECETCGDQIEKKKIFLCGKCKKNAKRRKRE